MPFSRPAADTEAGPHVIRGSEVPGKARDGAYGSTICRMLTAGRMWVPGRSVSGFEDICELEAPDLARGAFGQRAQDVVDTIRIVSHVDVIDVHPAAAHGVEVFATETARRHDMVLTISGGQLIAEADDDVARAIKRFAKNLGHRFS